MNKFVRYLRQSSDELLNRVTWSTWSELKGNSLAVIMGCLLFAFLIFAIDEIFGSGLLGAFYTVF